MIQRTIYQTLVGDLTNDKITVITGARQVGKSTMMKLLFDTVSDKACFITFDDTSLRHLFEENPKLFVEQYVIPYDFIFIDEFQYAYAGGKILKYMYDTTKKKFVISGSSKPEIAIQSLQYLVGRVSLHEMYPLSFKEFVSYKSPQKRVLLEKRRTIGELSQLSPEFTEFILFGGYPDVVKEPDFERKKKILRDLIQVYLLKEIKDILQYKESSSFEKLLTAISLNHGNLVKISNISNSLNIEWHKIKEYIHVLEKTNIVYVVNPFFSNKLKEITKTPKIYFHDTGFVNTHLKNFSQLHERNDGGQLLESFVVHELIKSGHTPHFWNKNMSEVDFIIEKNNTIVGIECKSNQKTIPRTLKTFIDEYKPRNTYVLNLKNDADYVYNTIPVIFMHYINLCYLLEKDFM